MSAPSDSVAQQRTAYIGRFRTSADTWRMQLMSGDYGDIYAEIDVPDDSQILALADEFLYAIAAAKDLNVKARRGNDE